MAIQSSDQSIILTFFAATFFTGKSFLLVILYFKHSSFKIKIRDKRVNSDLLKLQKLRIFF